MAVRSALIGTLASFYARSKLRRELTPEHLVHFLQNHSVGRKLDITSHEASSALRDLMRDELISFDDGSLKLSRRGRDVVFRGRSAAKFDLHAGIAHFFREEIREDAVVDSLASQREILWPGLDIGSGIETRRVGKSGFSYLTVPAAEEPAVPSSPQAVSESMVSATPLPKKSEPTEQSDSGSAALGKDAVASSIKTSSAFALIDIPSVMHAGETVEIRVGISKQPRANVLGEPLKVPRELPYTIVTLLSANRFSLAPDEEWQNALMATVEDPYPSVVLHLTPATLSDGEIEQRSVSVTYLMDFQVVGFGVVVVRVVASTGNVTEDHGEPAVAAAVVTSVDTAFVPDLTIQISYGDPTHKQLKWFFISPHLPFPTKSDSTDIGDAQSFAQTLGAQFSGPGTTSDRLLRGISSQINRAMPSAFDFAWESLHRKLPEGTIPSVLILSEEPYVPWELARVSIAFDSTAEKILGAQANVGRWMLPRKGRPIVPPPYRTLALAPMVAVSARYKARNWPRLPYAEAEVAALEMYGAKLIAPTAKAVLDCIEGSPRADVLHVALHGRYDATKPVGGLIMGDLEVLNETMIDGTVARYAPFVFLNACQVGNGSEVLGQYGGLSAAFLSAGARGVIAPLWNVNDVTAKDLALAFYDAVQNGHTPAEFLRARRRSVSSPESVTNMAYVLFGDPALRLQSTPG